jgi:Helix-turn-helix domain
MSSEELSQIVDRLERIEAVLKSLLLQKPVKQWYSTAEVAQVLGRAEYTVREWCRLGRIHAQKRHYARGAYPEWLISHEELERIQNQGLLPALKRSEASSLRGCR